MSILLGIYLAGVLGFGTVTNVGCYKGSFDSHFMGIDGTPCHILMTTGSVLWPLPAAAVGVSLIHDKYKDYERRKIDKEFKDKFIEKKDSNESH